MKNVLLGFLIILAGRLAAQPEHYTVSNLHSHNDYEQKIPFWLAYSHGFGSVEADIFLKDDELLVGHAAGELKSNRTLENLYLDPIRTCIEKNKGHVFADSSKQLQLLIDVKTEGVPTLNKLVEVLQKYPLLLHNRSVRFVISGNRPDESAFASYPSYIWFDGELFRNYSQAALGKIVLLSDDFKTYAQWNGKSNPPQKEWAALQAAVAKAHRLGKPVRFWDAPDFVNAWYFLMRLQVDYINTDHIPELASFINKLPAHSFTARQTNTVYQPLYKADGTQKPVKNVILLIGDGMSFAQLYAAYTANRDGLNIFKMKNMGLSKTSSYDNYITDSAPGSTAFSSGEKTNNRFVGVDHTGAPLPLLPELLAKKNIRTGLVTCGDIADATPADFYAHQPERDDATAILGDLKNAPVDILMGSGDESLNNVDILRESSKANLSRQILKELEPRYTIVSSVDSVRNDAGKKWIVIEKKAGLSILKGRGDWLEKAFSKTLDILARHKQGFFMMTEGAQIDYGGHANSLPYVTTEVLDFDKVVGDALRFADKDGETLVIVTADHETGGLTLLDGDYAKGYVSGQFASNDHTALPVPVFAYGPQSDRFRGVYENTALFGKILAALGMPQAH